MVVGFSTSLRSISTGVSEYKTGIGLGLSIVRQIVLHMQGQVGFDDAPGGGTIFYVDLPSADHPTLWPADAAAEVHATPLAPAG